MGQAIPRQHPAVVLRSHFNQLRALLAIALVAVAGLTTAVVILANDSDEVSGTSSAKPIESINYGTGVVNPSTGYPSATIRPDSAGTRYDGGPEEGTRGVTPAPTPNVDASPAARYDGGPEEGSADVTPTQPKVTQQQAFPGLSREANGASADASPSQSGTKDYSMNGATGDTAAPPAAKSGSRADGDPDKGTPQSGPRP
jgi:hypothetical protein